MREQKTSSQVHSMKKMFFLLVIFSACQISSYDDFREKGRSKTRSLVAELKKIRTKDQLIQREENIRSAFGEIALLLGQLEEFQQMHLDLDSLPLSAIDRELSDQLRLEISRICRLDGGKDILERCKKTIPKQLEKSDFRQRENSRD